MALALAALVLSHLPGDALARSHHRRRELHGRWPLASTLWQRLRGHLPGAAARRRPRGGPIDARTNIVFYGETGPGGVGPKSSVWIRNFLGWWKSHDPSIHYAELKSRDLKRCDLASYPNLKVHIEPGGDAYKQQLALGPQGKSNLLRFIARGGAYVGICAGYYLASEGYAWNGQTYRHPNLLGLTPPVEGPIVSIADYNANQYRVTKVGEKLNQVYYGGPKVSNPVAFAAQGLRPLLRFDELPGKPPAAVQRGRVLLFSTHPEASWQTVEGLSREQMELNYIDFANRINQAAGTHFKVPEAPRRPLSVVGADK